MLVGELTVLVMVPNDPEATLPLGTAKAGWLSRLKALAPIWKRARSAIGTVLVTWAARLRNPGPRKLFGGTLPKSVCWTGLAALADEAAKEVAAKQGALTSVQCLPNRLGSSRSARTLPPKVAESSPGIWPLVTENGLPL